MTGHSTTRVLGVGTAVPEHVVGQSQARDFAGHMFGRHHGDIDRLLPVFDHAGVDRRHFCVPADWFEVSHTFRERNDLYLHHAMRLSVDAARAALADAAMDAADVGTVLFVSTTGMATPSLDARLALELGCPPDVRRDATFGHGCAGGVGGLARAAAFARAEPGSAVLLVATELCSLTFQGDDWSKANFVSTSLFADGAAAVVVRAAGPTSSAASAAPTAPTAPIGSTAPHGRPAPDVLAATSVLWPDTEDVMGFEFTDRGLEVVLSRSVPNLVRERFAASVEVACERAGIVVADIDHYLLHPGGAKVLDAYADVLPVDARQLCWSRDVLRTHGNMSAPTALFVLRAAMDAADGPAVGDIGLVSAMGPGFAAEHVVLRW
jgi:alkylresorcinol/alkylpyrone synthase